MPIPRIDDANIEFSFTSEEATIAQVLDPIKIAWLQTKYAKYWKMKNSTPVPESAELDRSYFVKIAELDGRLGLIQELLDDHKTVISSLENPGQVAKTDSAVAERASNLVDRIIVT